MNDELFAASLLMAAARSRSIFSTKNDVLVDEWLNSGDNEVDVFVVCGDDSDDDEHERKNDGYIAA
jgi:hypothetical protein